MTVFLIMLNARVDFHDPKKILFRAIFEKDLCV